MAIRDSDGMTLSYAEKEDISLTGEESSMVDQKQEKKKKKNRLDSPKYERRLRTLETWFDQEWQRQAFNRYQMAMDEDYYDSLQYTEEESLELQERGQAPVVYNEIKPSIDWMIGTERRTRMDYKVLPRRREGNDDAETKTKLLKYLSDVNKQPFARSECFARKCKGGLGWLEIGIRQDETDEPIFYRSQDWRYMLYDSNGVEKDLSDSRYVFRWKYLDVDVACEYFPDRADIIKGSSIDGSRLGENENEDELWYMGARVTEPGQDYASASTGKYRPYDGSAFAHNRRTRVKLIECWYRMPKHIKKMDGGDYDGEVFDAGNDEHNAILQAGNATLYDQVQMEIRVAIYCEKGLVWESSSPYDHGKFPFVPDWAYRRARDNAPYSPIRPMRDPQDSLNKRGSKALWIVSTNRIVMDENAVDDIDELREEAARPDSIIEKKKGYDFQIDRDIALAEEHLRLMDRDMIYIRNSGGVTAENLGRETNADSGKAIIARQEQGGVVTTELFDNHRLAVQLAGEIELALVEQFYTEEKQIRIVGERNTASFVSINEPQPDGTILNDVTAMHADFVVAEQDYRDSLRQAMFESLFDIVSRLAQMNPQIAMNLLDLVVEMADVPNRDELVQRIRDLTGQKDPDKELTEEEIQQQQQAAQLQQYQMQLQLQRAQAELDEVLAKRESLSADAIKKKLDAFYQALEAAGAIAANPGLTRVADSLMGDAGFIDATPDNQIPAEQQPPAEQTQPQLPQPSSPFEAGPQG